MYSDLSDICVCVCVCVCARACVLVYLNTEMSYVFMHVYVRGPQSVMKLN